MSATNETLQNEEEDSQHSIISFHCAASLLLGVNRWKKCIHHKAVLPDNNVLGIYIYSFILQFFNLTYAVVIGAIRRVLNIVSCWAAGERRVNPQINEVADVTFDNTQIDEVPHISDRDTSRQAPPNDQVISNDVPLVELSDRSPIRDVNPKTCLIISIPAVRHFGYGNETFQEYRDIIIEESVRICNKMLCSTCDERFACIVFIPCGHLISCEECAISVKECYICHQIINRRVCTS